MSNIMDFWKNEWDEVTSTDDLFDDPQSGGNTNSKPLYKLIEYDDYSETFKDFVGDFQIREGIKFKIGYLGNISKYTHVDWIQTTTTDYPMDGKRANVSELDTNPGAPNLPFYLSKNGRDRELAIQRAKEHNSKKYFEDTPTRIRNRFKPKYYFLAQLSLVGKLNGTYVNIITFEYGFDFENDTIKLKDFKADVVPDKNRQYFNYKP